jgi:hypothetical protein
LIPDSARAATQFELFANSTASVSADDDPDDPEEALEEAA